MYTVLIVDDEPLVRRGIKTLVDFEALKIDRVLEAADGVQALALFEKEAPDIVLADINMPKMDGLRFSERIKSKSPQVKIALITGYDYFDYALTAIKIGIDDYVLKPVTKEDVAAILQKLVNKIEEEERQEAVEETLAAYVQSHGNREDAVRQRIQALMDSGLSDPDFSLKALGEALGYSSGYLSGLFKKHFGKTFQDYLLAERMERAKLLLLTTAKKHYEIAEAVGIRDVNYFSTRFKKYTGTTPRQYRERVKEKSETTF
ncbi:response regulator transcription factor [Fusibacter sp. JL298sf-3]